MIAAYCEVIIVIDKSDERKVVEFSQTYEDNLRNEFGKIETNLRIQSNPVDLPDTVIEPKITRDFILALKTCFNGMSQMNWDIHIPQTSSNLGVVKIMDNHIEIITLQRSPDDFAKKKLAYQVGAPFELIGAAIEHSGDYPGWLPNLSSEMLKVVINSYEEIFDHKIKISATHGGLECGLILGKIPHMDAVSIGATIRDPHSANERLNIQSVNKVWGFLKKILVNTPRIVS